MNKNLGPEILKLRKENLSYREIASALDCSISTVSFHCGEGQKEKNRQRARNRINEKRKYVQEVKQKGICSDCKENYPYYVMEFDHVRGTKIADISKMTQFLDWSLADVIEEIQKCELVCSNCHKIRTYTRLVTSGADTLDIEDVYGK